MRKKWLAAAAALVMLCPGAALAAQEQSLEVEVCVNGFPLALERPALLERETTLVPVEDFCAAAGTAMYQENEEDAPTAGQLLYRWAEDGSPAVTVGWKGGPDRESVLTVGENGVTVRDGVLYAPVRPLAEALGFTVDWDGAAQLTLPKRRVEVRDLAGLLNAVAPDTEVVLAPGTYSFADLDRAQVDNRFVRFVDGVDTRSFGGQSEAFDVTITGVRDLTIRGGGATIVTPWAYADVLRFENSSRVRLEDFTAVHDVEPGYCMGDCLELQSCADVTVAGCTLDGSGAYGLWAVECSRIALEDAEISHCTYGAVSLLRCREVSVEECRVHDCADVFSLFSASQCKGTRVRSCEILSNWGGALACFSEQGQGILFEDCVFWDNSFSTVNEYGWESSGGAVLVNCREGLS